MTGAKKLYTQSSLWLITAAANLVLLWLSGNLHMQV